MTAATTDPERLPVVVASGQSIERYELVTPLDLMARAAEAALADAPGLRSALDRVTAVNVLARTGPAPATELALRLGLADVATETTSIGGNTPQWLVTRAAAAIARGELGATLIAGSEALRSSRARRADGQPRAPERTDLAPDPVVGDDLPGSGPEEMAIGLVLPVHVYPMLESVVSARQGHDAPTHRLALGKLFAPFTEVAASNPYAWFPEALSAEAIATPGPTNRLVAEPYTKRMTAFLGSDQGAALLVCSLAAARRAGVADRAVFIWSGADAVDVRYPVARPDLGRSPGIRAAGRAAFAAAGAGSGSGPVTVDDCAVLDLYSCFPSAVELAADALGLATDDRRGLTATGGLPYFGGPGNNYATHGIAAVTDALRSGQAAGGGPRLGLATGLGWFVTKHAVGIYADRPPPAGFHEGDTADDQARIDASAVPTAAGVDVATPATVLAATVVRDNDGAAVGAPVFARLADGRQLALAAADDEETARVGRRDVPSLVGSVVVVEPGTPRYRLATD